MARDPRQARFVTWASLRWVWRHRAWSPYHLACYWRFFWKLRVRNRHVVTRGMVFLAPGVQIQCRPGYARMELGRFVHVGRGTALRVHEGRLRIGDKVVLGGAVTVNAYLDVEVGASTIVADDVYLIDFDHRVDRLDLTIKDQGIVKSPVRVGPDVWIGAKASVLRGVVIGAGAVVGAHAVVTRDVPAGAIVAGVPARVIRHRGDPRPGEEESAGGAPAPADAAAAGTAPAEPPPAVDLGVRPAEGARPAAEGGVRPAEGVRLREPAVRPREAPPAPARAASRRAAP